mgnify:CR=1 FL=1
MVTPRVAEIGYACSEAPRTHEERLRFEGHLSLAGGGRQADREKLLKVVDALLDRLHVRRMGEELLP